MGNYLVQRLATILPTLFFVSILIFGLQQLLPGDPAIILAGEDRDPSVVAHLHEKFHLDDPLPVRYLYWAGGVLKDRPIVYLFHRHWLWAHTAKLAGLRTIPDGLVRVQGLKMN